MKRYGTYINPYLGAFILGPLLMLIISTLFYGISQGIGIGLLTYCGVKSAYYLFTDERGMDKLPSPFTIIFTLLTCIQFFI